ncbi:MAG: UxaA family hydrolase [Bdellovibrionales bacterium]
MNKVLRLHPADNIAVVVSDLGLGPDDNLATEWGPLKPVSRIPKGHKVALAAVKKGQPILKFNHVIGVANEDISIGSHVHVHNVVMPSAGEAINYDRLHLKSHNNLSGLPSTFKGYRRRHGRAGTRNFIAVVATVNCSATVVKAICQHFRHLDLSKKGIDGVIPITHSMGCAQAIGGLNYTTLNNTIAGWTHHPNVVANLYIGLGCEGTTYTSIKKQVSELGLQSSPLEKDFRIQDVGGTQSAIKAGIKFVEELIDALPIYSREELPIEHLALALNCGGSDAFSSLTANPALGIASDILTHSKATSVLAEIPECHGAEYLLTERAVHESVKNKLNDTFEWWQRYSKVHKVELNNNLSPGNIEGGITTIIEKSLGAVSKGGSAPLADVVDYAHPVPTSGFALMNTPGFDPVSVTGLVAGGCNIVCFTTGRGSVYGCSIAPTVKVSTNTALYKRMPDDIDFDAGTIISEGASVESVGRELFKFLLKIASGEKTKSEQLHLGWEEFTPWPIGETL